MVKRKKMMTMMIAKKIMILKQKKQLHTNYSLLIVIDLCKENYQTLLITYQELTIKNANHSQKEKKLNHNVNLLDV